MLMSLRRTEADPPDVDSFEWLRAERLCQCAQRTLVCSITCAMPFPYVMVLHSAGDGRVLSPFHFPEFSTPATPSKLAEYLPPRIRWYFLPTPHLKRRLRNSAQQVAFITSMRVSQRMMNSRVPAQTAEPTWCDSP